MMKFKIRIPNRQGQQLIEYMMLFAIVVVILIAFVRPGGPFRTSVNQALNLTIQHLNTEAERMK